VIKSRDSGARQPTAVLLLCGLGRVAQPLSASVPSSGNRDDNVAGSMRGGEGGGINAGEKTTARPYRKLNASVVD
jgi:hypothetical protein